MMQQDNTEWDHITATRLGPAVGSEPCYGIVHSHIPCTHIDGKIRGGPVRSTGAQNLAEEVGEGGFFA